MKDVLKMKSGKRLVGVIHLAALPESPAARLKVSEIAKVAAAEARILLAAGFDAAIIENFGDAPFFRGRVPPVTVSAMTACALAVREAAPGLPLGINVLRNDVESALAIAEVVEAEFVRVNVYVGARVTDQGVIEGDAASVLRQRKLLGAENVEIWADVDVKHSAPLAPYPVVQEAADAVYRGGAATLLVTGEGTGKKADSQKLKLVRGAVPGTPVLVASGATVETLPELATVCDGAIVGSALREAGRAGAKLDEARVRLFAEAFRKAFKA